MKGERGWRVRAALLRYELLMLVRDTRTVLIAVVAPVILFPVLILIGRTVERAEERRIEETTFRYAVVGDSAEWAADLVDEAIALELPGDSATSPARLERVPPPAQVPAATAREAVDSLLEASELHVLVWGLSDGLFRELRQVERERRQEGAAAEEAGGGDGEAEDDDDPEPAVPAVVVDFRASSDFSRRAAGRLRDRLSSLREHRVDSAFAAADFPVDRDEVAAVDEMNVASSEEEAGAIVGLALTPFLLFLMLSGGSIVAADAISGEKERGTLETLLTSAAHRSEIVGSKLAAVVVVGLAVTVVNVANLLVYLVLGVFELPEAFRIEIGLLDLGLLLVLLAPVTVVVASALLLLSGYSKSYREYQIYFFPLFLVFLAFSLAGMLPGIELRSAISLVPISGVGVAVREIMVGDRDWPFLLVAFLSTGGAAWWLARLTERTLSTERLIGGAELDEADLVGGPALWRRHAVRWFGVMWVVFLLVSMIFGGQLGLRSQILVNLAGIFLGGSVLAILRYRLPVKEALALRLPSPRAWPAVLLGAPSALVVGVGISTFVNAYVFPVPDRVIESFGQFLLQDELPLWQLVFFVAVVPGVLEEIAFRGVLLHGLRRSFRPVALCLVVGAIFGLFHVSLFRLVPTAYLGAVLTAVVLLTGSIYPAMLWHFLNNAVALVPARLGWMDPTGEFPPWVFGLGALGLVLSFALLWTGRRPYPDLRTSRPRG